jgi:hypothetical protein
MSEAIKTETILMELDKAFQFVVTLAWEDLMKAAEPSSVHVEYPCEPGTSLKNQGLFTRPADACRDGLVLIYPPDGDDRTGAATWMRAVRAPESDEGAGEAPERLDDHGQYEDAWPRMDDEGYPNEPARTMPDATEYSGYEWLPIP